MKELTYTALHSQVLLIAKQRVEGTWSCYCTPVPGISHDKELYLWECSGSKVRESIARAAFPQFEQIEYSY